LDFQAATHSPHPPLPSAGEAVFGLFVPPLDPLGVLNED